MVKLLKIIGRIIGVSFEWILIFILFFVFAIHTSPFQTFITQKVTSYLSNELKTEIKVDQVSVVFFNRLALDGFLIKDQKNDTLAYISTMYATLDDLRNQKKITLKKIEIDQSIIRLNKDKTTGNYNYSFLVDYFSSRKKSRKKPLDLELNKLQLIDVDLEINDFNEPFASFGMDYEHLKIRDINLNVKNISFKNNVIKGNIKQLSAKEKCGFNLKNFSGRATVSKKGVYVKNVKLKTPFSNIYASKVNLKMNHYEDFLTFEDSVSFDASLQYSKVSMKDVSYFVPDLEGMDQIVRLKANVSRKTANLKIADLTLRTGEKTSLEGNINLPDFRNFDQAFFNEKLDYAYISLEDLKKIKLPKEAESTYLQFEEHLERLGYFEAKNARLDGFHSQFVFAANKVRNALGSFQLNNGILFTENKKNNSYFFEKSQASEYDVKVDSFNLGKFLKNSDLGKINGTFFLSGEAVSFSDIHFNDIEGKIHQFDFRNYSYRNITVQKGKFIDNVFDSKIEIKDDNLNLVYEGIIDLNGNQHMIINIDLTKANLDKLNLSHVNNSSLISNFKLDISGNQTNNIQGTATILGLEYIENGKKINIPNTLISLDRNPENDIITIQSKLGNATVNGKIDFRTIIYDFENQISKIFPAIIPLKTPTKKQLKIKTKNQFNYNLEIKEINELLVLFVPDLKISSGTKITGSFNGITQDIAMEITSNLIQYQELKFENIHLSQQMSSTNISVNYDIEKFFLNDSINVNNLNFNLNGTKDVLYSKIIWNTSSLDESSIHWNTSVLGIDKYNITLLPSFFSLKQKKWNIINESKISINASKIDISNFLLEREKQYLAVNGSISEENSDQLNFRMNDFKLDDFSSLFGSTVDIKGLVNGWGYISNPYTNLTYIGDANIQDLYINNHEIGNVFVQTQWDKISNSFGLTGDLIYRGNETFSFDGHYYSERINNNLDFNLIFDNTDIQFTNAFMDPDVITGIRGLLVGEIKVEGSLEDPRMNGDVQFLGGNAKLELLDVNFGFNGKISSDKYGFYINNMPIFDEEGHTGSLVGSIYHTKFEDWNFDLNFNLLNNSALNGFVPGYSQPLEKFLIMNTKYDEETVYYGKCYATGTVNIFGYSDNIEINADLKSEEGTKIYFPLYGTTDINEKETFISFKQDLLHNLIKDPKIDFTGVELKLNLEVTPEAEIKVILDEVTGEEIFATGSGDITISLDNLNNLTLDGTYKIKKGYYDFVMKPINQKFIIQENSTISWSGDPFNANLNLKCFYVVAANINEISPNQNLGSSGTGKQDIVCYLILTESLLKPAIAFDIQAPNANETGKTLLGRIKSDPDMLNKQFFTLLLAKKFQRIDGQTNSIGGSSAALDLLSSQINTMLSQVTKEYKLNVALDKNNITGGNLMAVGVTKGFYGDRLVLTGSFGVGNTGTSITQNQNSLIGDVNLAYSLNESGTFKVNIFNESNQNTILQNKQQSLFTQGAGIEYQEDFNTLEDFKLFQYFLDIFRKKENKKIQSTKKKKRTPVPLAKLEITDYIKNDWNIVPNFQTLYLSTSV